MSRLRVRGRLGVEVGGGEEAPGAPLIVLQASSERGTPGGNRGNGGSPKFDVLLTTVPEPNHVIKAKISGSTVGQVTLDQNMIFVGDFAHLIDGLADGTHPITYVHNNGTDSAASNTISYVKSSAARAQPTLSLATWADTGALGDDETSEPAPGIIVTCSNAQNGDVAVLLDTDKLELARSTFAGGLTTIEIQDPDAHNVGAIVSYYAYVIATGAPETFSPDSEVYQIEIIAPEATAYTAQAVRFNAADPDYLLRNDTLNGAVDSKKFMAALFVDFKGNNATLQRFIIGSGNLGLQFTKDTANRISVTLLNPAAASILIMTSAAQLTDASGWKSILVSVDLTAGVERAQLLIDGVMSINGTPTMVVDGIADFTQLQWTLGGGTTGGSPLNADVADFAVWFGESLDLSQGAILRKFIDTGGRPVDLGATGNIPTGNAPIVWLHGATSTWHTNDGTGGGFTLGATAVLTDGASSPST